MVAAALVLGALGALLAPAGHVHSGADGSWAHQHFFAGPHSHPADDQAPREPAGEPSGEPFGEPGEAPDEERGATIALALALSLELALPCLGPAAAAPFLPPPSPQPPLPRGADLASPGGPRGPPAFPC